MKREVPVEKAVGMVLAHDLTQIIPGEFKGVAFKLGHIIREEDIPRLLDMGKRHVYVLEPDENELHENEGATRMAKAVAGPGVQLTEVHEGKVNLKAARRGLLWVDAGTVTEINRIPDIAIITRAPFIDVAQGTSIGAVRPIPLLVERAKIERVEALAARADMPVIDVLPYQPHKAAIVTTGSEIQTGRVADKSGPVLREKFAHFGVEVLSQVFPGDEVEAIVAAIVEACERGATIVCVTGGMSVDPDDRSPGAIRRAADTVVRYGMPLLPGSMTMLAYRGETAIFGLPGAVIHDARTAFDVLLPRVLAGLRITEDDIAELGVGGWLNA
ncbi:MAG: molybdopterin-binding protein [Alicyclobacillus herbarius]|uniref:molybdopterin-binding protein n=1 Tax=Alicyclobacillus herbarius TaxID=122960 RepID=UPI002352999D|nr:molybdopterin-binding protein [Alicyclobacillus herbarius]MCL6633934.1 molybdopterin-binding protein [Alicyclobacillus herbarius]